MKKVFSKYLFSVKIQNTPNPSFLKFIPGKKILKENQTIDFPSPKTAENSSLAKKLFEVKGVGRILIGSDYISIGKKDEKLWEDIKPQIVELLNDYFEKTENIEHFPESQQSEILDNDSETLSLIKEIISNRIRPVIQEDGGDIKLVNFDENSGIVRISLKGSCSNCPSSTITLKNGIEKMLMHYVPQVNEVESIDDEEEY